MFDNLKKAFSDVSKGFSEKELNEKDIEDVLFELEINLLESDVAIEVIDSIKNSLKEKLIGTKVEKKTIGSFVKKSLIQYIDETFDDAGNVDLIKNIKLKKESGEPYIIVFVGINGTGKTTTLAKIANMLKNSKFSLVISYTEIDTRAGRDVLVYAARFPAILVIAFGCIAFYFKSKGGYKPVDIDAVE